MINLPSFHPFFVLKLEVRALLQNVCNGICRLVASKIFSGEDSPRHPYDSRAFSARSRTKYFKLATPLRMLSFDAKLYDWMFGKITHIRFLYYYTFQSPVQRLSFETFLSHACRIGLQLSTKD